MNNSVVRGKYNYDHNKMGMVGGNDGMDVKID